MSKIANVTREITNLDNMSAGDSFLHRRHPLFVMLACLVYIICVASYRSSDIARLFPMLLYPVVLYQIAQIEMKQCFLRLKNVLPFIIFVGIWNPIFERTPILNIQGVTISLGWIIFLTLLLKCIYILMASFLMFAVMGIDKICYALHVLKVPNVFVNLVIITYRYLGLLSDEADRMWNAYKMRAPGQKGIRFDTWGSFLGQLLIRSMDRARELYRSMQMRGYSGDFSYLRGKKADASDFIFLFVSVGLVLLMRFCDVSQLIGNLFI